MVDQNRAGELREAIEALFFAYRAFTSKPDRILERRGLGRVHHRILYFVARHPAISVNGLLDILGITKQALNAPLRQLVEMQLVHVRPAPDDRRVRQLQLSGAGATLERQLTETQARLLEDAFRDAGADAEAGWRAIMKVLAANRP